MLFEKNQKVLLANKVVTFIRYTTNTEHTNVIEQYVDLDYDSLVLFENVVVLVDSDDLSSVNGEII